MPPPLTSTSTGSKNGTNATSTGSPSEEEDDYLTMALPSDPAATSTNKKETLTQLRKRKMLHAETAGRPKSKAELAKEAARKREEGLNTNLLAATGTNGSNNNDNKGLKMMKALGYVPGEGLGKKRVEGSSNSDDAKNDQRNGKVLLEPIGLAMKEDRSGIGRESEAKRKFREEAERATQGEKKRKVEADEFVERVRMEREEKRNEGLVVGAQKVAERLEDEDEQGGADEATRHKRTLQSVPVLWRGLVRKRELDQRDARMRNALYTSLSSRPPNHDDHPDEEEEEEDDDDDDDKVALGKHADVLQPFVDDEDLDAEDDELEAFDALPPAEKLQQIVAFLRQRWRYCFWCKYRYEDEGMEGCPGLTEDEHG